MHSYYLDPTPLSLPQKTQVKLPPSPADSGSSSKPTPLSVFTSSTGLPITEDEKRLMRIEYLAESTLDPDRTFHNSRDSKSADQRAFGL